MTHFTTDIHILDPVDNRNNGYDPNLESKYAIYPRKMNEFLGLRSYHSFTGTDNDTMLQNKPDIASPRLWKPESQSKTIKSVSFSHSNDCYSPPMSPSSRTQAIARGRKEMMDMVRDLPESFYELSLKDIVEKQPEMDAPKETSNVDLHEERKTVVEMAKVNETKQKMSGKRVEKKESNRKIGRSQSIEKEKVLLKTSVIFPVFLGSKKNKKGKGGSGSGNGNGSGRFRITPKPKQEAMRRGSSKGVEKDWWKKRTCKSSESDDSSGLSNSGSSRSSSVSSRSSISSGRHKNGLLPGFCFFIGRKIKGRKHTHS